MNNIVISGYLGQDPEVKEIGNGKNAFLIAEFSVANKTGFGDKEKTHWISCKVMGKRAEVVEKYLFKGKKVTVSGELHIESWESRDGDKKSKAVISVKDFDFEFEKDSGGSSRRSRPRDDEDDRGSSRRGSRPRSRDEGDEDPRGGSRPRSGRKNRDDYDDYDNAPF